MLNVEFRLLNRNGGKFPGCEVGNSVGSYTQENMHQAGEIRHIAKVVDKATDLPYRPLER